MHVCQMKYLCKWNIIITKSAIDASYGNIFVIKTYCNCRKLLLSYSLHVVTQATWHYRTNETSQPSCKCHNLKRGRCFMLSYDIVLQKEKKAFSVTTLIYIKLGQFTPMIATWDFCISSKHVQMEYILCHQHWCNSCWHLVLYSYSMLWCYELFSHHEFKSAVIQLKV